MPLSSKARAVLAAAYQLRPIELDEDATSISTWQGTEAELLATLERRRDWTPASEYARYYVADVRLALQSGS